MLRVNCFRPAITHDMKEGSGRVIEVNGSAFAGLPVWRGVHRRWACLYDRVDARKLSDLLYMNKLKPVYHDDHGLRTLKVINRLITGSHCDNLRCS